jgi:hypothetical protein
MPLCPPPPPHPSAPPARRPRRSSSQRKPTHRARSYRRAAEIWARRSTASFPAARCSRRSISPASEAARTAARTAFTAKSSKSNNRRHHLRYHRSIYICSLFSSLVCISILQHTSHASAHSTALAALTLSSFRASQISLQHTLSPHQPQPPCSHSPHPPLQHGQQNVRSARLLCETQL